jgi:hypothetical protein
MALIGVRDVCWGFGEAPLLENVTAWWAATGWASPPC